MIECNIRISGPGLVVNSPAAIVKEALEKYGYTVNLEDFAGQYQNFEKETWQEDELAWASHKQVEFKDHSRIVKVKVDPLPWGG